MVFKGLTREDWIGVCLGVAFAIASGVASYFLTEPKLSTGGAISLGVLVSLLGFFLDYIYASTKNELKNIPTELQRQLEDLRSRIDLQCQRSDEDYKEIADTIDTLIKKATDPKLNNKRMIRKKLNGVNLMISKKGIEGEATRNKILECLSSLKEKFVATSVFNIQEWMDPFWFTYLAKQLAICATKNSVVKKRYFIYSQNDIEFNAKELLLLFNAHEPLVEMYCFKKEQFKNKSFGVCNELNLSNEVSERMNIDNIPDLIVIDNSYYQREEESGEVVEVTDASQKEIIDHWLQVFEKMEGKSDVCETMRSLQDYITKNTP